MNRTAAILLLPIMMIFAIQPVIAMHFCGGKLKSMDLFAIQSAIEINAVGGIGRQENHSCCGSHKKHEGDKHDQGWSITGNSCCNTQWIDLSTDDFQVNVDQHASRILSIFIDNVGSLLTGLIQLPDPKTDIHTLLQDFPPEGFFLKDVSLLTYICIYRI